MSKYKKFIFNNYRFDKQAKRLELSYSYDDQLNFSEIYTFDFDFINYNPEALEKTFSLIFYLAGVSYFKMFLAKEIAVKKGQIDENLASFLNKTYLKGLGEFFYVNHLDPSTKTEFPINTPKLEPVTLDHQAGLLIGLGGGKDSLLSVELLSDQPKVATWSLGHISQLEPLVKQVGLKHFFVKRELDPQISSLNLQGALNGHIPISAIISAVGSAVAVLSGFRDVIVSNESSASEANLIYQDVAINHQYSKSLEYERDFQQQLKRLFNDGIRYYSLLRPFSELRIAELFTAYFNKYKLVFSSCNRAFRISQDHLFWCGECPKCAFAYLIFTPFIDRDELSSLWHNKNLLLDPKLETTYRELLGISGDKPLDCVGEIKEARTAMILAQKVYPELKKYNFDVPLDYDYKAWSDQAMPDTMLKFLKSKIA
jgi:hypothetical protein